MACTTHSALDYVKIARCHLVGKLKNLSVIVENLQQEGVFTEEDVSKIQAEREDYDKTRTILDSVTKQGEDACYKFLRIIDMTRKRSSGRTSLIPEKNTVTPTSSKMFSLDYWISCFPFKEDPQMYTHCLQGSRVCHGYQAKLKLKAKNKSNEFWMRNKNVFEKNHRPNVSYTSLVLDTQGSGCLSKIKKFQNKKRKLSRPKKHSGYIPENKPGISPMELLKTDKNILLVGKPGIGKTALSHEILKVWSERDNRELDYMFYFDMRETAPIRKAVTLQDLLFGVYSEPDEGKDEVFQDMKMNSDNVTVIFDGITDLSSSVVSRIVAKDLLPNAKIIITCRADDEEDFLSGDFLRVEVKGFSEQTIKTYFSAILGEDKLEVLSNLELLTLCHVPMYALMVAACLLLETAEASPHPCSTSEIYINIVRHCLQINSNQTMKGLNSFITKKSEEIMSLAEAAFQATEGKTVTLTDVVCEDICVLSFLKQLVVKVAPTETKTSYAFLHYTVQEFFAALWLVKSPDKMKEVLELCCTEERKHMKHLIPFMCRLLTQKNPSLGELLIPAQELETTSSWFYEEMIKTFSPDGSKNNAANYEDSRLFLCQCLYESQRPEACVHFLETLDYHLDLSGETLDSYSCCAVAYVVNQSKGRKIQLNLEDVVVSEQGVKPLFGCLDKVEWCDPLTQQLWEIVLLSTGQMDVISLLCFDGYQLHLPVHGKRQLFERAGSIIQKFPMKVNVCVHWDNAGTAFCQSLCQSLFESLHYIRSLRFRMTHKDPPLQKLQTRERAEKKLFLDLCLKAALFREGSFHNEVKKLGSLFSVNTNVPDFLLDFYQHFKTQDCSSGISKLRRFFQSASAVWIIDLSQRKTSILLEVLKLQSEKKHVKLTRCSDEESEVRTFLQCLPYISQLSFPNRFKSGVKCCGNLFCAAAERDQQTGEKILEQLSSLCRYETFPFRSIYEVDQYQCGFLMDLCSHVKDYEIQKGLTVLPSLKSVFQLPPVVWPINLSQRKTSILLEVLKLQSEKKHVELTGCSDGESEVRTFLQCLPYISRLSVSKWCKSGVKFCGNLLCAAAERDQQTGEKILELLSSLCRYEKFNLKEKWCDFSLDLYSYEAQTCLSVLPLLQSVFQSDPAVWSIDLSQRKTSILLEVLKLQSEKKHVRLTGWSDEEGEVRTFLQCLPYISQLSFPKSFKDGVKFFGNLFCAAAEREEQTGEKILELLSSVCRYDTFPSGSCDDDEYRYGFLLDLCSYVKDYETKTGLNVLLSLQPFFFQSDPAVWTIDLSQRKTSILLEVLKLQSEKKPVKLTGWSDGEGEVRTFLQCLPYISQLSFADRFKNGDKFCVNLFFEAAERDQQTGEKILELLSSVCRYETFPFGSVHQYDEYRCGFLLDLCSHVKDCENKKGLSVLPSLKTVFQSAPAVWSIDLSQRKTSILLEVLKLQSEKKHVELTGWSGEEGEVRTFLQCLPYISELSFYHWFKNGVKFCGNLFCAAAERDQQTGEKILELLSSVCTYETFPRRFIYLYDGYRCGFLLDLCSHVKDCETKTGLSVLPSLKTVFQSAPAVWSIDLSQRKTSILLEVLKLQSEKKHVKLTGCSAEEGEVRTFLQCLPYMSRLSFPNSFKDGVKFCVNLFCAAAEREQQTGEKILELLSPVCTDKTFPLRSMDQNDGCQTGFLLDLCSHVKDYETKTGLSVLPSLRSVFQSTPAVWSIDLSQRKTSILLEVLKLQSEKKPVELRGCSDEESEVKTFLQCLPYISQLSFPKSFKDGVKFCGNLFCAAAEREQQTGEKILELLSSVCTDKTFTFGPKDQNDGCQIDFLLDLCSHVKDYETKTGLSVLPSLKSVFQSASAVWSINFSQRKTSILLEVLKLQSEKRHVKLTGCSDEESEVRTFLQCLPYISQLSFYHWFESEVEFCGNLFCAAAEREQQTGEKVLELLSSVCSYKTFPLRSMEGVDDNDEYDDDDEYEYGFLLDLCSQVKDYETEKGLSVLPSLKSVFQSAPAVWSIDLSERKASILLEVLKLQSEKKHVRLTGWSDGESEVRTFLQCLPYISELSCDPEFFQDVCGSISVRSREEVEQLASLLQLLKFNLLLTGEVHSETCRSVGRVLGLSGSNVDLTLTPRKICVHGVSLLFRHTAQLRSLRLSSRMVLLLSGWVRKKRVARLSVTEELSVASQTDQRSERRMLRTVSSLASLLRNWGVWRLDLTESQISVQGLIPLLLHDGPLTIRLSNHMTEELLELLQEVQDENLTWSFLSKFNGDLTPFCLDWELLQYLLQQSSFQTFTVNLRKNSFLQERIKHVFPFLDRIIFKRVRPSFVLTAIREVYKTRSSSIIPSLLRSLDDVINLNCREMDPLDCAALLFTLKHSVGVKLNLMWTSIPTGLISSILWSLDSVSELRVHSKLLLSFVHCCAASDVQQGAAHRLLRALQYSLNLSCSSCVELSEEGQSETLSLTVDDCRAVSTILTFSSQCTELHLQDCEVEDSGLDLLFTVLDKVRLRASKAVVLQLLALVPGRSDWDSVRRTVSLSKALGGELDLSQSKLDQRVCGALALLLDFSEGLTELDLSHCQLTDQLLQTLIPNLHKVKVLDLSHNEISDASTSSLFQLVSMNPTIDTVRVFQNKIVEQRPFQKNKQFEIW